MPFTDPPVVVDDDDDEEKEDNLLAPRPKKNTSVGESAIHISRQGVIKLGVGPFSYIS